MPANFADVSAYLEIHRQSVNIFDVKPKFERLSCIRVEKVLGDLVEESADPNFGFNHVVDHFFRREFLDNFA